MDGRSVGPRVWYAADSDQTRTSLRPVSLLRAGTTPASSAWEEIGGAALAYVPETPAELKRGALFTLARSHPAVIDWQPGAALALRYLRQSFYTSLCHQPGRALDSAVSATAEYLRALAWQGHALADCELVAAVVQGSYLWLVTAGTCVAYLVRPTTGGWRQLAAYQADSLLAYRAAPAEPLATPAVLEPGDLVLLTTQVPETLIQSCLLTLLLHEPGLSAQDLADTLTRLSAANPGSPAPLAVVLDCQAANPALPAAARSGTGYRALAVPAGFPWDDRAGSAPAASGPRTRPQQSIQSGLVQAPPPPNSLPPASPGGASALAAAPAPAGPVPGAAPLGTSPSALTRLATLHQAIAAGLPRWITTQGRLARVLAPGTGLLAGMGFAGSWLTGQWPYLLAGCSLSGIVLYSARPARPAAGGSAAVAKGRLLGTHPAAPAAAPPPTLAWTRNRLLLPPVSAVAAGCLDIISLRDVAGRISAQLVLLCPAHLLASTGGYPGGIYVVLHDLITDRQQMVAWLAPGQRWGEAVLHDVDGYSGNPAAHVRWLRGRPRFELASTRLRVALTLDRYRFTDAAQKQHIESLEVLVTATQILA